MGDIGSEAIKIILGSLIPVSLGAVLYKPITRRCEARRAAKAKRDALLEQVAKTVKEMQDDQREMGSDVRCLYSIMLAQLDASEISLKALHGEHLNGNVDEALRSVQAEQAKIRKKLLGKVCDGIGEGVD